jgi:hypothetical protein
LLHVILTPPGRYQHPHDTSNPPVGRWGNCEPKWWPQGSSFCLLKNNIDSEHKAKRGELNGLVVHVDVRIGLALYGGSCRPRCELNLFFGGNKKIRWRKKVSQKKKVSQRQQQRGHQRELARKGRPRSQLRVPICGGMSTADAHSA